MKLVSVSLLVACVSFLLNFSACSNAEAEAEIARLKQENVTLQAEIKNLQGTLDSIKSQNEAMDKTLSDLDMKISR